jgi:hypothetical protein
VGQALDNGTPYTQQWGLNLQFEPRRNLMVEAGYQGAHGLRQPIQWVFNLADLPAQAGNANNSVTYQSQCPAGTFPDRCSPIQERVPFRTFSAVTVYNSNFLQSVYHAATLKVEQRFTNGLQVLGSFTYGKAIDQFSEIQNVSGAVSSIAQDGRRFDLERGVANFDQRRRLVMSWLYEIPVGKGRKFLSNPNAVVNAVIGGWQINGIVMLADGTPLTIGCFCGDRAQIGNTYNVHRMNQLRNAQPDSFTRTIYSQFDTTAFATPALGTLGTGGRNTVLSTGQRAGDVSMFKNFKVREQFMVQFRAEAFNVMASPYYSPRFANNNATAPNFSSLVPVGGDKGDIFNPRIFQLALRVTF